MATPAAPLIKTPKKKGNGAKAEKHTIQIAFTTEEDIQLFKHMEAMADADRRSLPLYALLQLHKYVQVTTQPEE